MRRTFKFDLSPQGIDRALRESKQYRHAFMAKVEEFTQRLADIGLNTAKVVLTGHEWSGETLNSLTVEDHGHGRLALVARSEAILYFEFGTGVRFSGQTHPKSGDMGMGAGTNSPSGHWNDPRGWWFEKDGEIYHTYGQPPQMPMYKASQAVIAAVQKVAKEVFGS